MKELVLGTSETGNNVCLSPAIRKGTHTHVVGGSGTGKSKFLESLIRQDLREGQPFCLIDWHGTLFDGVLRYCAENQIGLPQYGFADFRNVLILDPSKPDFITGFNPFQKYSGATSAQVSNLISATVKPWGMKDTRETPTLERILRILYSVTIELGVSLPVAFQFLDFENRAFRETIGETIKDPYLKRLLRHLQHYKSPKEWDDQTLSTLNRLTKFIGSEAIRRHVGSSQTLDLMSVIENNQVLLINLGQSDWLAVDDAKVFACWLLNEFFRVALQRAHKYGSQGKPPLFVLYMDEFQEYITDDMAAMLDEVRKGGLHLILAHTHLAHLDQKLRNSVFTNARIRATFGGTSFDDGVVLANEMFLPDLNSRQIKNCIYHTNHLYQMETLKGVSYTTGTTLSESDSTTIGTGTTAGRGTGESLSLSRNVQGLFPQALVPADQVRSSAGQTTSTSNTQSISASQADTSSTGWSQSHSKTVEYKPAFVPVPVRELTSETEWTLEEKRSRVAEMLKYQRQRHFFLKIDNEATQPLTALDVRPTAIDESKLEEYKCKIFQAQGALPAGEVDRLLEQRCLDFLDSYQSSADLPSVRKKRKTKLHDLIGNE